MTFPDRLPPSGTPVEDPAPARPPAERVAVLSKSGEPPRALLGFASLAFDECGQQVLQIDLRAMPYNGRIEVPIRDVLILAKEEAERQPAAPAP